MPVNSRALHYKGFSISVPESWDDITALLDDNDPPLTIADPDSGVGALQISPAIYKSGLDPQVSSQHLSKLLDEFASDKGLGECFDRSTYSGRIGAEGASFHSAGNFVRVWYASDGKSVMLVTYVCEWAHRDAEDSERETAVRSIRFDA